jgi:hypothetical protein
LNLRAYIQHHSELLQLPEQYGCQRSNWRHALLLLYLSDWVVCKWSGLLASYEMNPPDIMYPSGWKEPKNRIRPEEDDGVVEEAISAKGQRT